MYPELFGRDSFLLPSSHWAPGSSSSMKVSTSTRPTSGRSSSNV